MNNFHHADFQCKCRRLEDTFVENRKLVFLFLLFLLVLLCLTHDQTGERNELFCKRLKNVWKIEICSALILP